ncbi:hypothetical protein DAEQUDRAFT_725917 [Daedalea quercina L-15889]|uniref:NADH dehydrogenase [ubiquinone] 1 alpha subcomplex subunit n=1 Tax=Daedalea quercina L-15889 TaxID=1314783 RepID=A0A165QUB0_9APHY|nr:hypothetical protein DAEQUDRAFT_725917 [Daedalea quercina L-15889]
MSFLRRVFDRLMRPTYLVGRDLEGNKYYEYPSISDETSRTKRVVKYRPGADMLTYVAGKKRLPVQWTAWLTHTRLRPPTVEELHADLERQLRVQRNAALIEARDREERALQLEMESGSQGTIAGRIAQEAAKQEAADSPMQPGGHPPSASDLSPASNNASQLAPSAQPEYPAPVSDEPQAWSPRTIRRG